MAWKVFVSSLLVALAAGAPGASAERRSSFIFYTVTFSGSGSYAVDYGDDRLKEGVTTAVGVDGKEAVTWSWKLRTVAYKDGQKPVQHGFGAVLQASYESTGNVLYYIIQMGKLDEDPRACNDRRDRRTWDGQQRPAIRGDWVRWEPNLRYERNEVLFGTRIPTSLAPKTAACYHSPFEGDGNDAYVPETDRTSLDLPLRHGQVVDLNQLHTVQGQRQLSITITRVSEERWRRLREEFRAAPAFRVGSG